METTVKGGAIKIETPPSGGASRTAPAPEGPKPSDPYDALTDLFLGEVAPGADEDRTSAPPASLSLKESSKAPKEPRPLNTTRLAMTTAIEREERDVAALSADRDDHRNAGVIGKVGGETASESDFASGAASGVRARPFVEGLILGHLPVLGSVWAMQYVRHIAKTESQPVGMLRVQAGVRTIEVVSAPGGRARPDRSGFDRALTETVNDVSRWAVRLDELYEPDIARSGHVDAITILTGSDEAAMASAFRIIKSLGSAFAQDDAKQESVNVAVRVAFMGSGEHRARPAYEKLLLASRTLLGRELGFAACIEKVESSGAGASVHTSRCEDDPMESVKMLSERLASYDDGGEHAAPATPPIIEPKPALSGASAGLGTIPPELETTLLLAASVPGLRPIAAKCPYATKVGLAIDPRGGVHLLAAAPTSADEQRATQMLLTARDWLNDHYELVRLTLPPAMALDPSRGVTLHVFTHEGGAVTRLLRLGARVHLAAPGADEELGVVRYIEVS